MAAPGNIVSVMASKTKTKKKHFVAQKVKLFRASDPLLRVLMWGVNHSAAKSPVAPYRLTDVLEHKLSWVNTHFVRCMSDEVGIHP
ncbi:Phosphatidylinositol-5-phosphate 4-kinase type-2 alpha [Chelonia mydas]|uniref:Phosphatidylinositol-5-phosphate 4-kinase type-2 alpha n=1 Tax=Chelonia mydas TaxID=8469 RepID=M7BY58_CHEMY|nr:Phosphatidylinositol-5-phosphate 4-kinase type-2 alpha [Chelonia mydas]